MATLDLDPVLGFKVAPQLLQWRAGFIRGAVELSIPMEGDGRSELASASYLFSTPWGLALSIAALRNPTSQGSSRQPKTDCSCDSPT